jgi:uncharacterized protein YbaP (TraB family)
VALKTLSIWSGLAAMAAAAGLAVAPTPAAAEPAVWTLRDADSTIVLFGSVHLLPEGLDWRPPALDAALEAADDLWFETPTEGGEGRMATRALGSLPVGESLSAKLSPEGQARLVRASDAVGLSPAAVDGLRPWLADVTLSVATLIRDGARAEAGVEAVLAGAAPAAGRRYFETPWEQIAFLAEAPEADQLASLEETLRQLDEDPELYRRLVRAWLAGDQAALDAVGVAPLRSLSPVLYERLLAGRNRRWTEQILERLAGSGTTVIVVGAGHLTGPDGVPALLRARGVAVEGP